MSQDLRPPAVLDYAKSSQGSLGFIVFITSVTAIGGFLFGYDTAVISGGIGFLKKHFELSSSGEGLAGVSAIIGCVPGAMFAGFLSDWLGRKKVLVLCAVLYAVSGVASAIPQTFMQFLLARFLGGVGIGASSMICPVYIAEIAPERHRGRLGALFQLGIVIGIAIVFFVNMLIQRMGNAAWNEQVGWRYMLGSEALPAVVFLFLLLVVPESPRWLALHGKIDGARKLLGRIMGPAAAERELEQIAAVSQQDQGTLSELFTPAYSRPLMIAVILAVAAQFSGINSVMYYAPELFKASGGGTDAAFTQAVWVGAMNLVFTFVAILFVDKAGRRPLLIIGAAVQTVSLVAAGFMFGRPGLGMLGCILVFVAAFAMAMGPIPWIVIGEIFPGRMRGVAASIGAFSVWVGCLVVAYTFPILKDSLGGGPTFWIYAVCSLASLIFVLTMMPETKGKTLEEIEASWRRGSGPRGGFPVGQ